MDGTYVIMDEIDVIIPDDHAENIAEIGVMVRFKAKVKFQFQILLNINGALRSQIQSGSLIENKFMSRKLHAIILTGDQCAHAYQNEQE